MLTAYQIYTISDTNESSFQTFIKTLTDQQNEVLNNVWRIWKMLF